MLLVIAGVASGGGSADDPADPAGGTPADTTVPAGTPAELEGPLQDLHDAVGGVG